MMLKSVIFLLLLSVTVDGMIRCMEDTCDKMECEDTAACNGIVKEKGGMCGCCDLCVEQLEEGADCTRTMLIGAPPRAECKSGFTCHRESRKCVAEEEYFVVS